MLNVEMTEDEAIALTFIKKNKKITNGDYQKLNNTNRDKALIDLKKLISKGLITSQGVGSGTYYVLSNNIKVIYQSSFLDGASEADGILPLKMTTEDEDEPPKITTEDEETPPRITTEDNKVKEEEVLSYCQVPRSKREIMEHVGLKNASHFEKNYLKVLLQDGILEMTIPDKPTSRKQKYKTKNK